VTASATPKAGVKTSQLVCKSTEIALAYGVRGPRSATHTPARADALKGRRRQWALPAASLAGVEQNRKPLEYQRDQAEHRVQQRNAGQQNGQINDGLHLGLRGAVDDGYSMHPGVAQ
jgi:hypothetical protein